MKITGIQVLKWLNILFALLLCSSVAFAQPITVQLASDPGAKLQQRLNESDEKPDVQFIGQGLYCEAVGLSQLEKGSLTPILHSWLSKPCFASIQAAPAPNSYPATKGDCGLHSILTKGP